ncbi:hypothetical protein DdX_11229 [Ditylenchus destructor]|uniref:C2H2-type domain-containing protein n=1 Tax=Ditylenchus destructor TaxID=166010 RepID=A0AAD4MZ44_9BILA|nr:hypothetical protein DdX_11229 [Ditylenchus destructor]
MNDRRKLWMSITESTITTIKLEAGYVDYTLPESLAQCEECKKLLVENVPCFDILDKLEVHLHGKHHHNRFIYECSVCHHRLPTEYNLLDHYKNDHNKTTDISIEYILNEDVIDMQKQIRLDLISARTFLELMKYNIAKLPITSSPTLYSDNDNRSQESRNQVLWIENESSSQSNIIERQLHIEPNTAVEPNTVDTFAANIFAAKVESMSSAASALNSDLKFGFPAKSYSKNSKNGGGWTRTSAFAYPEQCANQLHYTATRGKATQKPGALQPKLPSVSSEVATKEDVNSESPFQAFVIPQPHRKSVSITEVRFCSVTV